MMPLPLATPDKQLALPTKDLSMIDVTGKAADSITQTFSHFRALSVRLFEKAELELEEKAAVELKDFRIVQEYKRQESYPLTKFLALLRQVERLAGDRGLMKIGTLVHKNAIFPPDITNIDSALNSIDVAYHMSHFKAGVPMYDSATGTMLEGIGHYYTRPRPPEQRSARFVVTSAYPCAFDQGVLLGMAQRFKPAASIEHSLEGCRKTGAIACKYTVTW